MLCRHCNTTTNLSTILCDVCAEKALHILPADPQERIHIYSILLQSGNPITVMAVEQLMKDDVEVIEQRLLNTPDLFYQREI